MRLAVGFLLGSIVFAGAGFAAAQVDCSFGCTIKYGLGLKPDYRKDEVPVDPFRYRDADFGPDSGGQSYFVYRSNFGAPRGTCGPERHHSPLPGQVLLRQQIACVPTSEGPWCTEGTNPRAACHLPTLNQGCTGAGAPLACCLAAGTGTCSGFQDSAPNVHECGTGGTCERGPGEGCRVEIVLSDGGLTPVADTSEVRIFTSVRETSPNGQPYVLSAATGNTIGGTSFDGVSPQTGATCTVSSNTTRGNVRRRPTMGTHYLLPANRGGGNGETYVRFDSSAGLDSASYSNLSTSFRIHTDDSAVCCNWVAAPGTCASVVPPGIPEYPLLASRTCATAGRFVNEDNVVPDWIFAGGLDSPFHTDRDFVVPGSIPGICKNNRGTACYASNVNQHCVAAGSAFDGRILACCTGSGTGLCTANSFCTASTFPFECCTGMGTGTCEDPCPTLDADPEISGVQPDTCDLTTHGPRVQVIGPRVSVASNNPALINDSRRDWCGNAIYVLRGTPAQDCSLTTRFDYAGDPGPDCGVINYGIDHRDDANCDGVANGPDLCPRYSEWQQAGDSDHDCGDSGGPVYPAASCRGDECECGDQAGSGVLSGAHLVGNGIVSVSDLVGINNAIFGGVRELRLCDGNVDGLCNVSDIVAANTEIFAPEASLCRQIMPRLCSPGGPVPCCGNGLLESSEVCDDGDLAPGDGCNRGCRVEFGFTCTRGSPSVCTPNP